MTLSQEEWIERFADRVLQSCSTSGSTDLLCDAQHIYHYLANLAPETAAEIYLGESVLLWEAE
jgi:hypothetical protein